MRKTFFILFLTLFLFSCKKEEPEYKEYKVICDVLNIREKPSATSNILKRVTYGDILFVNVKYESIDFAEVIFEGKTGYAQKIYLKEVESSVENSKKDLGDNSNDEEVEDDNYKTNDEEVEDDSSIINETYSQYEEDNFNQKKSNTDIAVYNYPKVEGSFALLPFIARVRSEILGEDIVISQNNTTTSTATDDAWEKLIDGTTDLIIVYDAENEIKTIIEKGKSNLIITPIGVDALAFFVNKDNKVSNLTRDELKRIYTGEINNWKQLGGDDKTIKAFQRPYESATQTMFLNLLMEGDKPIDSLLYDEYDEYEERDIRYVAPYSNQDNAIGYDVYHYVKNLNYKNDIKFLRIDGVSVDDESIRDGKYPLLNNFYVAMKKDTDLNSPTKKIYDYIVSEKGKEALIKEGYIPYVE